MAFSALSAKFSRDEWPGEVREFNAGPFVAADFHNTSLPLVTFSRSTYIIDILVHASVDGAAGIHFELKASGDAISEGVDIAPSVELSGLGDVTVKHVGLTNPWTSVNAGDTLLLVCDSAVTTDDLTVTVVTSNRKYFVPVDSSGADITGTDKKWRDPAV